ncbi:uncharacterized protein BJX67DRAFT_224099 [Aspergillus lucknowensis]|uniref:DUF7730 domain-containing protein n=1 Tax=Aspergillus lucknowensis TaxID=176173 RepID=A0ABR4LIM6_9EURO
MQIAILEDHPPPAMLGSPHSFYRALEIANGINPVKVYRAQRNPLHLVYLLLLYLLIAVFGIPYLIVLNCWWRIEPLKQRVRQHRMPKQSANRPKDLPPPLKTRKRRLTLPLRTGGRARTAQATYLQHQSLLFVKLPAEIRQQIYQHALVLPAGAELVVSHSDGRLYSFSSAEREEENPDLLGYRHSAWVGLNFNGDVPMHRIPHKQGSRSEAPKGQPRKFRVLGMLSSCRRVYSEAIDILYQQTTFNIRSSFTMQSLQATTLQHRFASIRSLHLEKLIDTPRTLAYDYSLDWLGSWQKACGAIKSIPNLRSLRVSFSRTMSEPLENTLFTYLEPLMDLKVPVFIVRYNWPVHEILESIMSKTTRPLPFDIEVCEPEDPRLDLGIGMHWGP